LVPSSGTLSLMVTRLSSIILSALRREQKPESLMYLFKRFGKIEVVTLFSAHFILDNFH